LPKHGFSKVTVPLAVFGSIRTYYYNNLNHVEREDWGGKGLYVNWWEADPMMVQPPFGLKTKWHDALRPLAQVCLQKRVKRVVCVWVVLKRCEVQERG